MSLSASRVDGVLDGLEEVRAFMMTFLLVKSLVISELEKVTLVEEISWWQKYWALWLKESDICTKFFHWVTDSNRRNKSIEALFVNCSISSDQSAIREHILQYYDSLLS